jgi:alkylated DNA repair dioxygenase AlkB
MQLDLFNSILDSGTEGVASASSSTTNLFNSYFEGQFMLFPAWLTQLKATSLLLALSSDIAWKEEWIDMFGKRVLCPRLTYWMGDVEAIYTYSKILHAPNGWHKEVKRIKTQIETHFCTKLNSCLLNQYRSQVDSVSWHQDNEPELGLEPFIASLSLGESRIFEIKNIKSNKKYQFNLQHGDLLIMQKNSQRDWLHQLPKTSHDCLPRINLTFRLVNPVLGATSSN